MRAAVVTAALLALAACTEKPQTAGGVRQDTSSFQGTGAGYAASGWKPGDRASWEQHMKTRTQQGQNDYVKAN